METVRKYLLNSHASWKCELLLKMGNRPTFLSDVGQDEQKLLV
jgi:hypothetical protein